MITAVCLNPTIDKTVWVETFVPGGTNRVLREHKAPGGKGLNTARALAAQGVKSRLAVLLGRENAGQTEAYMHACGCAMQAVHMQGAVRENIKVFDESRNEVTEINAAGLPVLPDTLAETEAMIVRCAQDSEWVVLSGSMPPGCPPDFYATLIRRIHARAPGCRVALDAEGECFQLGVREGPDLVKPNQHELSLFLGQQVHALDAVAKGARILREAGVGTVLVSMGSEGSLLCTGDVCLAAPAIRVPVKTTVGAGDAMLAGYLTGISRGEDHQTAFRRSVASATASVAGNAGNIEAYARQVTLQVIGGSA